MMRYLSFVGIGMSAVTFVSMFVRVLGALDSRPVQLILAVIGFASSGALAYLIQSRKYPYALMLVLGIFAFLVSMVLAS